MRTKNAARITPAEAAHMARVKRLRCSCCDGRGGYAHHIEQGQHFITVALCWECHQGKQGWHGNKTLWRIRKLDELKALNITLARLAANEDEWEEAA
jgi:hypothetical protein